MSIYDFERRQKDHLIQLSQPLFTGSLLKKFGPENVTPLSTHSIPMLT